MSAEATALPAPRTDTLAVTAAAVTLVLWASAFVLLAWASLGETPPALAFLGGAVCLVGVAVARRRPALSR